MESEDEVGDEADLVDDSLVRELHAHGLDQADNLRQVKCWFSHAFLDDSGRMLERGLDTRQLCSLSS